MDYLFKSERLGFRNWTDEDLDALYAVNSDPQVMEFFSKCPSRDETLDFIHRMQKQFSKKGFCYFAVELLESKELIGFIGIAEQTYEADFTPCVDIGWRIGTKYWYKGYATEGAKATLQFAKESTSLTEILSVAPAINSKSEAVMKKIGMEKLRNFDHPLLLNDSRLKKCVLYSLKL